MPTNSNLKTTFNKIANNYHAFRPRYPKALFTKLIADTHITPASNLLEIGPGTGQATEPLAKKGCSIVAVELGANLATKAREVLGSYPNVKIITGAFETTPLPSDYFDLVFSATAFHWIRPEYKFKKPSYILKPGGYLAIIHTEHVSDEQGDAFFFASQPIYNQFHHNGSLVKDEFRLPKRGDLVAPSIDETLFKLQSFTIFPYIVAYSGSQYAGLLSTYSPTIAMPNTQRQEFLRAIEQLITTRFNGVVTRNFAITLTIAKGVAQRF